MITIINSKNRITKLFHGDSKFENVTFKKSVKITDYVLWGPNGYIYKAKLDEKSKEIIIILEKNSVRFSVSKVKFEFVEICKMNK